jgi:hypothetical protein
MRILFVSKLVPLETVRRFLQSHQPNVVFGSDTV